MAANDSNPSTGPKSLPQPPLVILTTAFSKYAIEGYNLDVVDYLLKPFSFQRFVKAVNKALKQQSTQDLNTASLPAKHDIFIKSGYDRVRIAVEDIYYIRADDDYTEIHLKESKHLTADPLKYWEEELRPHDFIRVHKSYLINFARIQKVSGNQVCLSDQLIFPIGRAYKELFNQRLQH